MSNAQGGIKKGPANPFAWSDRFFESMSDVGGGLGSDVGSSLSNDLGKGVAKGIGQGLGSFFGPGFNESGYQDTEYGPKPERKGPQQTYYERFQRTDILVFNSKDREFEQQLEAVRQELKAIIKELEALGQDVTESAKVLAAPTMEYGKYHISLLEKIRQILKLVRVQLAESKSWLEMTYAKRRKGKYWNKVKKHGTSFSLNSERNVATQSG